MLKTLTIKGETRLSEKEAKKTREAVRRALGVTEEDAENILPRRAALAFLRLGAGAPCTRLVSSEGKPALFEIGADLFPTLAAAWTLRDDALPKLVAAPQVVGFILGGADLMLPGLMRLEGSSACAVDDLRVGSVALLFIDGNMKAVSVGKLLMSGAEIARSLTSEARPKGRCFQTLHVFGDSLWQLAGSRLPNAGFLLTEEGARVVPTAGDARAAGASQTSAVTSLERDDSEDTDSDGDDRGDAGGGGGGGKAQGSADGEGEGGAPSTESMDVLLKRCFLQAALALNDKTLPLPLNSFYSNWMRPNRPAGTSLDVKQSSYKKLLPFMRAMAEEGLCELSLGGKNGAEPSLVRLLRRAEAFASHERWSLTAERAEAEEAAASAPASVPLSVQLLYRPSEAQRPIFVDVDRKALLDEASALAFLEQHLIRTGACKAAANNAQSVTLDPLLCDALFKGAPPDKTAKGGAKSGGGGGDGGRDVEARALPTSLPLHEVKRRFVGRLEPWTRVAGAALSKPVLRAGRDPILVTISTALRRGHKVTLVGGLAGIGLSDAETASALTKALATAANVEETETNSGVPRKEVVLQGLWDRSVADYLERVHRLPAKCIENRAAGSKADMRERKEKKATNVRKA
uniref:Ligatin n=1 Tax=Chrysotila carterae TaxID=13221 RepID=A0A7S4F6K1_CHRCT